MKKILYLFLAALLLCMASCTNSEPPLLDSGFIIDNVTAETITFHVDIIEGEVADCGAYYGISKSAVSKGTSDKVVGVVRESVLYGEIVGLTPNQEYFVKAYVMNEHGRAETGVFNIKTLPIVPGETDNAYPDFRP